MNNIQYFIIFVSDPATVEWEKNANMAGILMCLLLTAL